MLEVKEVFKSLVTELDLRVDEGDIIKFVVVGGEIREGAVLKITGKGNSTDIQIQPEGAEHKETWSVSTIEDGTLEVLQRVH